MINLGCIVLLLATVSIATALQCYRCNSKDSTACRWGITTFTYDTEQCASAGIFDNVVGAKCYKITAKNKDGEEYIARGCQNPPALGCQALAAAIGWVSGTNPHCEICDTDKCNSASKLAGVTLLGVLLATFAFMF